MPLTLNEKQRYHHIPRFLYILVIYILSVHSLQSQQAPSGINYKPPQFIIEAAGSFELPVGNAYGHMADFFTFKNYGLVHGVGFHFNLKYGVNKKANLYPFISFGFAQLQNNDFGIAFIDSNNISNGYPLKGPLTYSSTPGSSILMLRDIFAGLGLQYIFFPKKPVMPFVGLELDYNYLWGYYIQTPNTAVGPNPGDQETFSINSTSRLGIGAEAGFDYRISQNLGFVFGTRFKFANLLGKKSEYTQPAYINPGSRNKINLLDQASTDLNTNLDKSRNITYLEFYLGFTLFIGKIIIH